MDPSLLSQPPPPPPGQAQAQPATLQAGPSLYTSQSRPSKLDVEYTPGNAVKNRELLYRMVISQLFYDGHSQIAVQLTNHLGFDQPCPPSDRLLHIATLGWEIESESKNRNAHASEQALGPGLDLEFETDVAPSAPEPGSADASIKVLDVERMLAKSNVELQNKPNAEQSGHPVIRTLYDHVEEVTSLQFHPREQILCSGSKDCSIKLFDYSKASAKKAIRTMQDAVGITSMTFHPSGEYLIVGTEKPLLRLYNTETSQCFVGRTPAQQHASGVTDLNWSSDGRMYASASLDGTIKVWDGVSSQCVTTFGSAHDGAEVGSVKFTRNGKYILSSGRDSMVKLWELSTSRCLIAYTGAGATGKQEYLAQACLNHSEDYVMFPDEATTSLCCWDSRSASRKQLLSLGHNGVVRYIVHSPRTPGFLTCSEDFRARFWFKRSVT